MSNGTEAGGGPFIGGNDGAGEGSFVGKNRTEIGGDQVGHNKTSGDQLSTNVGGNATDAVVGSKNVRQTHVTGPVVGSMDIRRRDASPDVTVNNYERNGTDLVDRLEEKLEAQINRLSDNMSARITQFESNMNWKLELVNRDIDTLKHNAGRVWLQLLTVIASLLIAGAMYYFASGLYSLSSELKQQRIEIQKSGVLYAKP